MEYSSITETAERWQISKRRVQVLCITGRIPGVARIGRIWIVPRTADKPEDKRVRSGRYVGAPRKRSRKEG